MADDILLDTPEKVQEFARQWRIKMDEDARQIAMLISDSPLSYRDLDIELTGVQFDHESFPDETKEFFQELDKTLSMMGVMTSKNSSSSLYSPYTSNNIAPTPQPTPTTQSSMSSPSHFRRFI